MQVAASPNSASTRSGPTTAKPLAPANAAFGTTLAASIANSTPVRSSCASERKTTAMSDPGLDAKANSKSDDPSEVRAGVQSGANTGTKATPKTSFKSGTRIASQLAPKASSKSATESDPDTHVASNSKPQVADPSLTAAIPAATNNVADLINSLPLATQLLVTPPPDPAAGAAAISYPPTTQLSAPTPVSSDDVNSDSNVRVMSLGISKPSPSVSAGTSADANAGIATAPQLNPLPSTSPIAPEFLAAASVKVQNPAGSDSPAALAGVQAQFAPQLINSATQTIDADSTQPSLTPNFTVTVPNDNVADVAPQAVIAPQVAAQQPPSADASQPAAVAPPAPNASVPLAADPASTLAIAPPNARAARTLRIDSGDRTSSLSSSAPTPKSPLPGVRPAPASAATAATPPDPQKSQPRADAATIPSAKTAPAVDPTSVTQPLPQKSGRTTVAETIQAPLRTSQDPSPSAALSSGTGTPLPLQTPASSETGSLSSATPALTNPNAAPGRDTVDAQQPAASAIANQQPAAGPAPNLPKKSDALPADTDRLRDVSPPLVSDKDAVAALAPVSNAAGSPSITAAKVDQPSELPKTQQMLDSAPTAPATRPNARLTPNAGNDLQMHVGIRTDAFGAVEIHTVVQQSQVGITVHGDRDLARWFSSEVPSIASGLKDHSLNLSAVDFSNGRSGVQTATSFQQGSGQRDSSQSSAAPTVFEDSEAASEASTIDSAPLDRPTNPVGNRVSILV